MTSKSDQHFITNYLTSIDPYFEIYANSSKRLMEINKKSTFPKDFTHKEFISRFENEFTQIFEKSFVQDSVQFKFIEEALNCISAFEKKLGNAFIYNFSVQFSEAFTHKLISFYSFLFHLRTVTAMNHNNQIEDSAFESIKCDAVSDYLAKTDFTVNDALLYWQFKKLATPFTGTPDVRVEKLFVHPLEQSFQKYNHNACGIFRFTPGVRFPGHLACGMVKFPIWKFLLVDGIAALISVPTQVLLFAHYGEEIYGAFTKFKYVVFGLLAVALIFYIYKKWKAKKEVHS